MRTRKTTTTSGNESVRTVSDFLKHLNTVLKKEPAVIQGEITDISGRDRYRFITLKDKQENAVLSCFVWIDTLYASGVIPEIGSEVLVFGYPSVYEPYGKLSFQVRQLSLVGEGALRQAFEALKLRLSTEGLFATERKKPLPQFPGSIGLITSEHADARKDFLTHLGHHGITIYTADVHVEGIHAITEIVTALRQMNETAHPPEVIVLTRGGGSLESLQAFNSEPVARAIAASRIPVLVGVGHENDITIADLVADMRASTPTDAGKILSQPWQELGWELLRHEAVLSDAYRDSLTAYRRALRNAAEAMDTTLQHNLGDTGHYLTLEGTRLMNQYRHILSAVAYETAMFRQKFRLIRSVIIRNRTELIELSGTLQTAILLNLSRLRQSLADTGTILEGHNPRLIMKKGYSYVTRDGTIVRTAGILTTGDRIEIRFYEGSVTGSVETVKET